MATAPIALRSFRQSGYTAFFSYAHADSTAWNSWVSSFGKELTIGLNSRLRGEHVKLHVSGDNNGAQSGVLSEQLQANIAASFSMFLFVHDNYVESDWCWRELKHFSDTFGPDGFRERLYLIVMSESALQTLWDTPRWRELFPFGRNQRSAPFFRDDEADWPLSVYMDSRGALLSPSFEGPFFRLREELVQKVKQSLKSEQPARNYPDAQHTAAEPRQPESPEVLVFIENPAELQRQSRAIGEFVSDRWVQLVRDDWRLPPPQMLLRPTGLPMEDLRSRPRLNNADGVILLWASKTSDTLAEEIRKLEPSLKGSDEAPGLIAYPVAGAHEMAEADKIAGWRVVRFAGDAGGPLRAVAEDTDLLDAFLQKVLNRKRKRLELDAMAPAAR